MELREQIARAAFQATYPNFVFDGSGGYAKDQAFALADAILAIPELADALAKRQPLVIDPGDYNPARKRIVPEGETFVKVTAT